MGLFDSWFSSPPKAPDFWGAAQATSAANRPGINGPYGQASWNGNQLNMSLGDPANNPIYNQAKSRLDPMWNQREQGLQSQLANQGLDMNSEAYKNATAQFGRDRNDAYQGAQNSAQQQQMQGLLALALPGLTQGPNYLQAAGLGGEYNLGRYKSQSQADADFWKGLTGLGGGIATAAMMPAAPAAAVASDERLKRDIVREGTEALPGVPFATWEYLDQPGRRHRGVIAQDLEKVAPQYVHRRADGMRMVDYSFLRGRNA